MGERDRLRKRYTKLAQEWPVISESDRKQAREIESDVNQAWLPIIETINLKAITWGQAADTAPSMISLAHELQLFLRHASHFVSCAERFITETQKNPESDLDVSLLDTIIEILTPDLTQYRFIWEELLAWEKLATHWATLTKQSWKDQLDDPADLHRTARDIVQWARAVDKQLKSNAQRRTEFCNKLGIDPSALEEGWYQFGNCDSTFLAAGVEGELSLVAALLPKY